MEDGLPPNSRLRDRSLNTKGPSILVKQVCSIGLVAWMIFIPFNLSKTISSFLFLFLKNHLFFSKASTNQDSSFQRLQQKATL